MSSAGRLTPSLTFKFRLCEFTVCRLINNFSAIASVVKPSAISSSIPISRFDKLTFLPLRFTLGLKLFTIASSTSVPKYCSPFKTVVTALRNTSNSVFFRTLKPIRQSITNTSDFKQLT